MELFDFNITALAAQAGTDAIASWSDERRTEFVDMYTHRTNAARLLLYLTAERVMEMAKQRYFISDRHVNKIYEQHGRPMTNEYAWRGAQLDRSWQELERIAGERAKAIMSELPPMKKAVQVIDPETARMITKVDKLQEQAQQHADTLDTLPRELKMSDHADMIVRDFVKLVEDVAEKRLRLLGELKKVSALAKELEITIAKRLYAGLPGISEAVMDVVTSHMERAVALENLNRRVAERIKFGDSEAAMELLKGFETDEATISTDLRSKLAGAMAVLKAKVKALPKARTKALPKARTKKGGK